jgi:Outer membrane protein beta-barrel domain
MDCSLRNGSRLVSLLVTTWLATPGAALAADNGFYLGGAASDVSSDYSVFGSVGPARDDDSFKLIGGVRPLDSLAIEANYVDLGTTRQPLGVVCITIPCPTETAIDSRAISVSAIGMFTLPLVDLYGRVGVARWESERRILLAQDSEGTDPTYGAGVQVRLGSFALRVEYERFELGDDSADMRSIGFTYTFL